MYSWIIKSGGRRFLLIVGGCAIFTLLFIAKYLDQSAYILLIGSFTGGYLVANGKQKHDESKQEDE